MSAVGSVVRGVFAADRRFVSPSKSTVRELTFYPWRFILVIPPLPLCSLYLAFTHHFCHFSCRRWVIVFERSLLCIPTVFSASDASDRVIDFISVSNIIYLVCSLIVVLAAVVQSSFSDWSGFSFFFNSNTIVSSRVLVSITDFSWDNCFEFAF